MLTFKDIGADRLTPRHNASTSRASRAAFQASMKSPLATPNERLAHGAEQALAEPAAVAGSRFGRNLGTQRTGSRAPRSRPKARSRNGPARSPATARPKLKARPIR